MVLSVVAVAWTVPDWRILQTVTQASLKRSITKSLDASRVIDRGLAAYVAALGEFQKPGSDYVTTIREPGSLLKHIMITVLVAGTPEMFYELAIDGDIDILDSEKDIIICSANLERWRTSIINYCSLRSTETQRKFYSLILAYFDKMGLSSMFESYSRDRVDGNYLLVKK